MENREALILKLFQSTLATMKDRLPDEKRLWECVVEEVDAYFKSIDEDCFPTCYADVEQGARNIIEQWVTPDSER